MVYHKLFQRWLILILMLHVIKSAKDIPGDARYTCYKGTIFSKAVLKCRRLLEHENLSKYSKYIGKFLNSISQISESMYIQLVLNIWVLSKKIGSMCHLHFKMPFEKIGPL